MHYIVKGLGYGDEGKGSIIDFLTSGNEEYEVIKEGGPNAAHHIISKDGRYHRSEQMGSGVLNKEVRTFCSKNMLIEPLNLITENQMLEKYAKLYDGMERISIDSRCPIVTPLHAMIGRLIEISREHNRYGSTGMGVGQTVRDKKEKGDAVLSIGDILDESILEKKVTELFYEKFKQANQIFCDNPKNIILFDSLLMYQSKLSIKKIVELYTKFKQMYSSCIELDGDTYFDELLHSDKTLVFEGSQGILLDPEYGFKPYVTKTPVTFNSTMELIAHRCTYIEKIGVLRAYSTRHGPGPFVTEDKKLTKNIPDMFNTHNEWQGYFRIGWLDLVATRYALSVDRDYQANSIALTNLDKLSGLNHIKVCVGYEYTGEDEFTLDKFFEWENIGIHRNSIKITGFKHPKSTWDEQLSNILFDCKPLYLIFEGWKKSIEKIKTFEDLPIEAKEYVNYIQSAENGLDIPISIISVGPTSENKIVLD